MLGVVIRHPSGPQRLEQGVGVRGFEVRAHRRGGRVVVPGDSREHPRSLHAPSTGHAPAGGHLQTAVGPERSGQVRNQELILKSVRALTVDIARVRGLVTGSRKSVRADILDCRLHETTRTSLQQVVDVSIASALDCVYGEVQGLEEPVLEACDRFTRARRLQRWREGVIGAGSKN